MTTPFDPKHDGPEAAARQPSSVPSAERGMEILINGLISADDLSSNTALHAHIAQVLARVGVERVEVPIGASFDPSEYEAVTTVVTGDPVCFQRVAETLRPGWRRQGTVLRSPQVAVWIADPDATASTTVGMKGVDI